MGGAQRFPILVAGGGLAGLRAALDAAATGREVLLVEAGARLGGGVDRLPGLVQTGEAGHDGISALVRAVAAQPGIRVIFGRRVAALAGEPGRFRVALAAAEEGGGEDVSADAVILATGCVPFDPDVLDTLGHAAIPDVVTSLAFEGQLAGAGRLARPSDGAVPASLAFLLCVGSRQRHPVDRGACSGICCAVALRQALAAGACARTIFAMDLRAHVPGTQEALDRAEAGGVAVRYARPHTLVPGPDGRGVAYRYVDTQGKEHEETVDMVVLAVGLEVSEAVRSLARGAGIALSRHGFVRTGCFEPVETSRAGVFVAGALRGPGEASLAAVQGSAAAQAALAFPPGGATAPRVSSDSVLVVGGGVAGLTAALALAGLGCPVTLIEATGRLGGNPRMHPTVWKGRQTRAAILALTEAASGHPLIRLRLASRLTAVAGVAGEPGRFTGILATPDGPGTVDFGAAILALGGVEAKPDAYLHGRDPRVFTQLEFENWRRTRPQTAVPPQSVVFIQCVGSRQPGPFPACARVCCIQALCAAVELKKSRPETQVAVFFRDIAAYGENEDLYTEARRLGVLFFRYTPEEPPKVERLGTSLAVTGTDQLLGRSVRLRPDCLVLAAPLVPSGAAAMAGLFGCAADALGFLVPAHPVFSPVDTTRPGVFAAGLCLGPKPLDETVAEARAAAMRAVAFLAGR